MEICEIITSLKGLRKGQREQKLSLISKTFYNYLKSYNYHSFKLSLFYSFFPNEIKKSNKQRITKEVLRILISENKIKKTSENKTYTCLENKPLSSLDYGSYNKLMSSNGYKVFYYNWSYDNKNKIPKKVLIGKSEINQKVNFSFQFSEIKSHKPKAKQGVYTNSPFSVIKRNFVKPIVAYEVL